MYLQDNGTQISIYAKIGSNIVFILPLYISQRVYNSAMMNSWDGSLTFDKDNGTIAIIGPKRMEYSRVVNLLEYIKKQIER